MSFGMDGGGDALGLGSVTDLLFLAVWEKAGRRAGKFSGLDPLPLAFYMTAFTFIVEEHLLEYGSVVILGFYLVVWNLHIGNASVFGVAVL